MGLLDTIKELFGGAHEHIDQAQNTVQSIGDNEVAQNFKDKAADVGAQAQDSVGTATDKAQEAATSAKDKLGL